jgi:hypothetical protein
MAYYPNLSFTYVVAQQVVRSCRLITEKVCCLEIFYSGEVDDTCSKIEKERYGVEIEKVMHGLEDVRDLLNSVADNLMFDIHEAAIRHFMRQTDNERLTA